MKILVSGGAGFIGSHVCDHCLAAGHEVMALDDLSRGKRENLDPKVRLEIADLRDRQAVDRVIASFQPDAVSHHAAQVSVRDSVADPAADAAINVLGGLNLLESCVAHNVRKFVFASTGGAIYGEQAVFPAAEDHPAQPLSPYGIAKLALEKYLYYYENTYGLGWTALRYSNVYGPRQDPRGEAGVVAIFCQRMLAGRDVVINGDGGQTRDFVFVADVARVNAAALVSPPAGPVNVGTGIETDINQIFTILRELTAAAIPEQHGPSKPGEQRRSVLNPGRARNLFNWQPQVQLPDGLRQTAAFFRAAR